MALHCKWTQHAAFFTVRTPHPHTHQQHTHLHRMYEPPGMHEPACMHAVAPAAAHMS